MNYKEYKDNYKVYEDGTIERKPMVISTKRGPRHLPAKVMTPTKHNAGYLSVCINGKKELIHRVVAQCFLPNPDNKPTVNHKDCNKHNNHVSNLEWCTYRENHLHAFQHGRENPSGFELGTAKLTEDEVRFIRNNYKKGDTLYGVSGLSKRFNVSPPTIYKVIRRKSYKSVV